MASTDIVSPTPQRTNAEQMVTKLEKMLKKYQQGVPVSKKQQQEEKKRERNVQRYGSEFPQNPSHSQGNRYAPYSQNRYPNGPDKEVEEHIYMQHVRDRALQNVKMQTKGSYDPYTNTFTQAMPRSGNYPNIPRPVSTYNM